MKNVKRNTIILFFALILFVATCKCDIKAATFYDINSGNMFFKQNTNVTCTLSSAAMLVRRTALMSGNSNWSDITEASMRSTAWTTGGLRNSFSYMGINVSCGMLSSAKTQTLIKLLNQHPEGIVLYDYGVPHAILLTDYTDGIFYCADPSSAAPAGRIPVSQATITIESADKYWYVASPHVELNVEKPSVGSVHIDAEDGKVHYYCNVSTGAGASVANVNITTNTGISRDYTLAIEHGMVSGYIYWTDFAAGMDAIYTVTVSVTDRVGNTASSFATIDGRSDISVTPYFVNLKVGESYQFSSTVRGLFHIDNAEWKSYDSGVSVTSDGLATALLPGKHKICYYVHYTRYNEGTELETGEIGMKWFYPEINVELAVPEIRNITADTKGNVQFMIQEVAGAGGYQIERSKFMNHIPSEEEHEIIDTIASSKHVVTYAENEDGCEWHYRIRAFCTTEDGICYSDWSAETAISVINLRTSIVSAKNDNAGEIEFDWLPVSSAEGYVVYRSEGMDGLNEKFLSIVNKGVTSYKDTTVEGGKTYIYRIVPYLGTEFGETINPVSVTAKSEGSANNSGTSTTDSEKAGASTVENGKPGAGNTETQPEKQVKKPSVSKVKSFQAKAGKKKLTLSWKKVSGAAGYQLQISTKKNFKGAKTISISKSKRTYTKNGLKAKRKYYVRIRAYKIYEDANVKTQRVYGKWTTGSRRTK